MKKLLYSFLIAFSLFAGGVGFAYDDGGLIANIESSGGYADDAIRIIQLVRYPEIDPRRPDGNVGISAGDVVVWDTVSDDGVTVNLIGVTGSIDSVAGVVVSATIPTADASGTAAQTTGRRNWGYIQTYGLNTNVQIEATTVAGQSLIAHPTHNGYATPADDDTVVGRVFGFAYDAESSDTAAGEAFINIR